MRVLIEIIHLIPSKTIAFVAAIDARVVSLMYSIFFVAMYSFASSFAFTATGLIVTNRDNKTWIDHRQRNHWIHSISIRFHTLCSPLNASLSASKYSTTSTQNTYSVSSNT
eukprot:612388_1